MTSVAVLSLALGIGGAISVFGAQQTPLIVIEARALVDVRRGTTMEDVAVVVQDGRIVSVGPRSGVTSPPGANHIRLPTSTLLPGLIDAHVHLTLGGNARVNAAATLEAGFTTVQDLGAVDYSNIELRDAIAAGTVRGPRVVASGPWLGVSGGICDFAGIGVRGADAFRARVREDVRRGADLIKVCVTGWLAEAVRNPAAYEIADSELEAAIDEAHRNKRRVAVHAIGASGIALAVKLGADLIVHGGFTPPGAVDTMKRGPVYQLPTLFSFSGAGPADALDALRTHLRTAIASGLPVALGTDAGVIPHGTNARELEHLIGVGLSPADTLRAATLAAADAVGLRGQVGALEPGALADVIGVEGNPLRDIRVLQRVTFVMKAGQVVRGGDTPRALARPRERLPISRLQGDGHVRLAAIPQ